MSKGWLGIGRKPVRPVGLAPDNAVAAPKSWAFTSVIVASTAALLGTSPDDPPITRYFFAKTLPGSSTELTAEAPAKRYTFSLRAESLGPEDVVTTEDASARLIGTIRAEGLDAGSETPFVELALKPLADAASEVRALTSFDSSAALTFSGGCATPTQGAPCTSELVVDLRRLDDGERGGSVTVDWQIEFNATATSPHEGPDVEDELPWSVEVTEP